MTNWSKMYTTVLPDMAENDYPLGPNEVYVRQNFFEADIAKSSTETAQLLCEEKFAAIRTLANSADAYQRWVAREYTYTLIRNALNRAEAPRRTRSIEESPDANTALRPQSPPLDMSHTEGEPRAN
ncbi:hypothetical protein AURDEDRAFT_131267 [Auricularia subglabra TFB-10046 SS5]|uniref:Uncharacterized protein n=1 Tax=Auricularia subglabra (strain TFB-10046 / SS5) TaxID=717982 RepID=J0WQS2_AURST|nr:hypothetical protein AURDEDRAFT_131267 [Auricularia subglabra TFB-10046 SS5]